MEYCWPTVLTFLCFGYGLLHGFVYVQLFDPFNFRMYALDPYQIGLLELYIPTVSRDAHIIENMGDLKLTVCAFASAISQRVTLHPAVEPASIHPAVELAADTVSWSVAGTEAVADIPAVHSAQWAAGTAVEGSA